MILMATTRLEWPTILIETKILDENYAKMETCRRASGGLLLCSLEIASNLRNVYGFSLVHGSQKRPTQTEQSVLGSWSLFACRPEALWPWVDILHISSTRCHFLVSKTTDFSRLS